MDREKLLYVLKSLQVFHKDIFEFDYKDHFADSSKSVLLHLYEDGQLN